MDKKQIKTFLQDIEQKVYALSQVMGRIEGQILTNAVDLEEKIDKLCHKIDHSDDDDDGEYASATSRETFAKGKIMDKKQIKICLQNIDKQICAVAQVMRRIQGQILKNAGDLEKNICALADVMINLRELILKNDVKKDPTSDTTICLTHGCGCDRRR